MIVAHKFGAGFVHAGREQLSGRGEKDVGEACQARA